MPGSIRSMQLEYVLRDVQTDRGSLLHGRLLRWQFDTVTLARRCRRGASTPSPEDVRVRATTALEKAILHGTTHMRTHLEVDPGVGLRSLEGVLPLVRDYAWAIDLQICVFPQEGLLNNPGTDELMVEALKRGCGAVGAAPYTDSDPHGQIDRVFDMAREFDVDIDMHLDFGTTPDKMTFDHVCRRTEEYRYGGRVAIGHVTRATSLPIAD